MSFTQISNSKQQILINNLLSGIRYENRGLLESREISVKYINEDESLELKLDQTIIVSRIFCNIVEPRIDKQNEGFLIIKPNLNILNKEKNSREIKKLTEEIIVYLDKSIKDSKYIYKSYRCRVFKY